MPFVVSILLAIATAAFAVCLNLFSGLSAHQGRLQRMYGERVFSLRAESVVTGSLYRFSQQDIEFIQDGLRDAGVAVAGLGLSYIDGREVRAVGRQISARSRVLAGRVILADVTPNYFEVVGGFANLAAQSDRCVLSEDLAGQLFGEHSPLGQSIKLPGGKEMVVAGVVSSKELLPIVDEPSSAGLVHRPGRRVIYRPIADSGASACYGYLLFETRDDVSLTEGMKSVSGFLLAYYPQLRIDLYSEYERFAARSSAMRSLLALAAAAALIGYAICSLLMHAWLSRRVGTGCDEASVRILVGTPPQLVSGLLIRRLVRNWISTAALGCLLYYAVSTVGVSLPALPAEAIDVAVAPVAVGVAVSLVAVLSAAAAAARKVSAMQPRVDLQ